MIEIKTKQIKVILLGASGMIGEGVLLECLQNPQVNEILVIGRKPCGIVNPKIKEIIHSDFYNVSEIANQFNGYDACFFCIGISSLGLTEAEYVKITHTLTLHFAEILLAQNKDMTFCFISGAATDRTEKGKVMWARVKGKTENDLMKLPFKKVFCFRPGFLHPMKGQKNTHTAYKLLGWLYPLARKVFPSHVSTMKEIALAMIYSVTLGYEKQILEVPDIVELSKK